MSGRTKGQDFERSIARMLSKWWSGGKRDDIFWRSSNSGGTATNRGKKGMGTFGHYGDIVAADPVGSALTEQVVIELKRGYKGISFSDLFDLDSRQDSMTFESFIHQVSLSAKHAKTDKWLLITKRDLREIMATFPASLLDLLPKDIELPRVRCRACVRLSSGLGPALVLYHVRLDAFFSTFKAAHFTR